MKLVILVTPYFNLAATMSFLDPFRAANYLTGSTKFQWRVLSLDGGLVPSSSGLAIETGAMTETGALKPDLVLAEFGFVDWSFAARYWQRWGRFC